MGKIIFLDIDGTIRDFDGSIPESAIFSIEEARRNGHKVCISSGRIFGHIEERVKEIGFDGIISGSGSYVSYEGKCISHKYFTLLTFINLSDYLLQNGCMIELQTHEDSYIVRSEMEAYKVVEEGIQKELGETAMRLTKPPKIAESVMDVGEVEKILFFSNELSNEEILKKWGKYLYVVPLSIPNPLKWGGEITPITVNKAEGIKALLKVTGHKKEDVIAVGDSENDIEMLQMASIGVAMGNGNEKTKSAADMVTAPLKEDGLKKAFIKLGLI